MAINVSDPDRQRAEGKLEARKREIDRRINRNGSRMTLVEFLLWWLEEVVIHEVKPSTWHNYKQRVEIYILPNTIAEKRICELLPRDIRVWLNAMRDVYAWSSIKQARSLLERALGVAVEEHYIEENPASSVRARRAPRQHVIDEKKEETTGIALTPGQEGSFLLAARTKPVATVRGRVQPVSRWMEIFPLYLLTIRLGLRKGEALGLRWQDIDWEARTLRIVQQVQIIDGKITISTPKTLAARRTLPLTDDMIGHLRAYMLRSGQRDGLVFTAKNGNPINPRNLLRHFKEIAKRAGLPATFRFHDLRHTALTRMREAGIEAEVIADFAGHEGVDVTLNTYTHTEARMRAAIEKMAQ